MAKIDDWAIVEGNEDPYMAPELKGIRISGIVSGHDRIEDGARVLTSSVKACNGRIVKTNNTEYTLGKINEEYRNFLKKSRPDWDWRNPITVIN